MNTDRYEIMYIKLCQGNGLEHRAESHNRHTTTKLLCEIVDIEEKTKPVQR